MTGKFRKRAVLLWPAQLRWQKRYREGNHRWTSVNEHIELRKDSASEDVDWNTGKLCFEELNHRHESSEYHCEKKGYRTTMRRWLKYKETGYEQVKEAGSQTFLEDYLPLSEFVKVDICWVGAWFNLYWIWNLFSYTYDIFFYHRHSFSLWEWAREQSLPFQFPCSFSQTKTVSTTKKGVILITAIWFIFPVVMIS